MPCVNCVERCEYDKVVKENESMRNSLRDKRERALDMDMENEKLRLEIDNLTRANSSIRAERDEAHEQIKSLCAECDKFSEAVTCMCTKITNLKKTQTALRSQLADARERCKHFVEQAAHYQNERDSAYEDATRQRTDYTNLMSECAKLKKMKDDFCKEACELRSALRARNALLQILFLATGISEEMLRELFNCRFHTSDASFNTELAKCMILHCINNNSTIIDTLTGYRFDIADRLAKAIEVRNIYGMPRKQGGTAKPNADTPAPEAAPVCDARHVATKKKKDVRAKPEQSQRRAKRGKAKPHQKGK